MRHLTTIGKPKSRPSGDSTYSGEPGASAAGCLGPYRFIFPLVSTILTVLLGTATPLSAAEPASEEPVQFNRHIRPLLADRCFNCHGPDENKRQAELRLDTEAGAFVDRGGYQAVAAGKPDASELLRRITHTDPEQRMPPIGSTRKPLTKQEVQLFRRWIEQGAAWQGHWAFIPPQRPKPPEVENAAAAGNAIDAFVLKRLQREGLQPSPEAARTTLIRRLSLDLTGLPPSVEEIDAFLADQSPEAYERLVDRLLDSPHFGERMAVDWLDGARYADTNGYQSDGERTMWRWRDWVIQAYNRNLPFDQFTTEQLAGDLLPNPTLDQLIATGFNRNHRGNAEGGIIPEEYAVEYVVDRVDTTATIWLGLTLGCARCHDHKFDPVSQKEFYQLYSFFNNVPENGKAVKYGNSPPMIKAPTRQQQDEHARLQKELDQAHERVTDLEPKLTAALDSWQRANEQPPANDWTITDSLFAHFKLDGDLANPAEQEAEKDTPVPAFKDGEAVYEEGKISQAGVFDGVRSIHCGDYGDFGYYDKFTCAAWIHPEGEQGGTILSRMTDESQADGYYLQLREGHLEVNLVKRWLDDALRVQTAQPIPSDQWTHVLMTYDGSRVTDGIKIFINGAPAEMQVNLDGLNQSFQVDAPLRIGGGNGPEGRFHGRIDDARVHDRDLSAEEALIVATASSIGEILSRNSEQRSASEQAKLRAYFIAEHAPPQIAAAYQQVETLQRKTRQLVEDFPTTMVMEEMAAPRDAYVLDRGQYDQPRQKVSPGVPDCLSPYPVDASKNRLGLARWLVDPANPLTSRVTVNRYWRMFFGRGLVETVDDFGSQGAPPSHPDLLDWLATEYVRLNWDTKAMLETIVMSATYRQSSNLTPKLLARDPENILLARGPRVRLSAHMLRDQALAAAGLLTDRIGGPSVKPYQPPGLWEEVSGKKYQQDHGEDLYRRSLYTYWKRTAAPPAMLTFDAAGRETCIVRQTRTNTPLQALTLLNDVTFVEAARKLAERAMLEGGVTPTTRLIHAFRLATARRPSGEELTILKAGWQAHREHYNQSPKEAEKLLATGEAAHEEKLNQSELAAYTAVASMILNLDEVITKE